MPSLFRANGETTGLWSLETWHVCLFLFWKSFLDVDFLGFVSYFMLAKCSKTYSPKWWFDGDNTRCTVWAPVYHYYKPMQHHKTKISPNAHKSPCLMTFQSTNIGIGNPNPVGSGDVSEFSRGFGTFETGDFPKGIRGINNQWIFLDRFDSHCWKKVAVLKDSTWMSLYSRVLCIYLCMIA